MLGQKSDQQVQIGCSHVGETLESARFLPFFPFLSSSDSIRGWSLLWPTCPRVNNCANCTMERPVNSEQLYHIGETPGCGLGGAQNPGSTSRLQLGGGWQPAIMWIRQTATDNMDPSNRFGEEKYSSAVLLPPLVAQVAPHDAT